MLKNSQATINLAPLLLACSAIVSSIAVSPAMGLELDFGLGGGVTNSDNATRIANDDLAISENRYSLNASIAAVHNSERINLNSNYVYTRTTFSEESQPDRSAKNGNTVLNFGAASDYLNLALTHSVVLTLADPSATQLLENLQERNIYGVEPALNLRLSPVDRLRVSGAHQKIDYEEQEFRNSTRDTAALNWFHSFSRIREFNLSVSRSDIEFESQPAANYTLDSVNLRYASRLRMLQYQISLGREETDVLSNNSYNLDFNFSLPTSTLGLTLSRALRDTSSGNMNTVFLDEEGNVFFDGGADQVDQIVLTESEILWTSGILCLRCNIQLSYRIAEEAYAVNLELDNEQVVANARFNYQFRTNQSLGLQYSNSTREFEGAPERDFTLDRVEISYRFSLSNGMESRLFTSRQERENTNVSADVTEENQYGLILDYRF